MTAKCKVCGRPLTSPESIAAGVGRECARGGATRLGKPETICPTCGGRFRGKDCPKCQPGLDPFAPSDGSEMPNVKEDMQ
jgi:hypothetical protein